MRDKGGELRFSLLTQTFFKSTEGRELDRKGQGQEVLMLPLTNSQSSQKLMTPLPTTRLANMLDPTLCRGERCDTEGATTAACPDLSNFNILSAPLL